MPFVKKNISREDKMFDEFQTGGHFSELYLAAYNCDFHTVRLLIKAGADVNCLEASQDSAPIFGAIFSNNLYMIQEFIRAGANVNIESPKAKVTPLMVGILVGSAEIVKLLLDNGADIHRRSFSSKTSALHTCALMGSAKVSKLLIERGLDVDIRNERDETPLHVAVRSDNMPVIRSLIAKGADISAICSFSIEEGNKEDEDSVSSNVTPIVLAVKFGHTSVADYLIKAGGDVTVATSSNFTPLHFAVQNGDFELVKMLLKAGARISVNVQSDAGHTPLSLAAGKGHVHIVKVLLKVDGIEVDPVPAAQSTPLVAAASGGNLEVVELLVAKGALVNGCTVTLKTPLHMALKMQKDDVAKFLIGHGADVNAADEANETPLHVACENSASIDIIKMLFEKGASLEARTYGATPFHFAAKADNVDTVKFLVERGADPNDIDEENWTALHYAAVNGSVEVAAFLVARVSDVNAMMHNLATPLHVAVENGHRKFVDILLKSGANVNAQDCYNCTPLHNAVVNGNLEIAELLLKERAIVIDPKGDSDNATPLFHAVENEDEKFVNLLLGKGADVNAANESGVLPIHVAMANENVNIVKMLLSKGAYYSVKTQSEYYGTPLEIARKAGNAKLIVILELIRKLFCVVIKNNTSLVELSVQAGAIVNARKASGKTALHFAVNNYNCEAVKALLTGGADITLATNKGDLPLQIAVANGCIKIPEVLLAHAKSLGPAEYNSVIDAKTKEGGNTVLHTAAEINKLHIVKFLLASGAVHNAKNNCDKTPIELTTDEAIKSLLLSAEKLFESVQKEDGLEEVLRIMVSNSVVVNAREADGGATPLHRSISTGQTDIAHALLSNGADYTLVTNDGTTALHSAASQGNVDIVKVLISRVKSDNAEKASDFINAATMSGTVALHVASNLQIASCLLQAGAIYDIRNGEDKTLLELTSDDDVRKLLGTTHQVFNDMKEGDPTVMNVLNILEAEEFKAVTSTRNAQGQSLVQVALVNSHTKIASQLIKRLK